MIAWQGRAQQASNAQRPNIIFICTDDQAQWTMGCSGNSQAYTPNMDRLAREGIYFENAFATTPVCSPARTSILTGQYASEYKIYDFIPKPGHKLYDPNNDIGLKASAITFAEVLKREGYRTGLVGKWHQGHWAGKPDLEFHPTKYGFEYFMGLPDGGCDPENPELEKDGKLQRFKGYSSDVLTTDALEYIRANRTQPFLLCINYRAPHSPWLPVDPVDYAPYRNIEPAIPNPDYPDLDVDKVKKKMKEYLASVSEVDRNLGMILDELDKSGISNNTVVIFTSDHGYNMGHNGIEHKGNGIWITRTKHPATQNLAENSRPNLYDNSLRVPALIRWPAAIKPGSVSVRTISHLDWFPTFAEIAGAKIPADKIVRGKSIVPLWSRKVKKWNDDFYAEYSMIQYSKAYMRAYRTPKWKLVKDFLDPQRDELYNLEKDPGERHNLMGKADPEIKKITAELSNKILLNMKKTGDELYQP